MARTHSMPVKKRRSMFALRAPPSTSPTLYRGKIGTDGDIAPTFAKTLAMNRLGGVGDCCHTEWLAGRFTMK
jgi:hypothetical protein